MAISQEQKTLVKIFQMCGLEKDIIIPLMIMLKNKPERMEQVVKYLDKEQREKTLNPDKIAREVMRIAMSNKV